MPPIDVHNLRFFVDETSLGVGKPLVLLRRDVIHTGHPLLPEVPLGSLDPDWMPIVAAKDLVVITRDRRIRTKHAKVMLLAEHGLRVFWLAGKKDLSNWDTMRVLARRWDELERMIKERGNGPWFMALSDAGIKEMPIRSRE